MGRQIGRDRKIKCILFGAECENLMHVMWNVQPIDAVD